MEKVIVVIGPTSVGKTKMGVALAKKFNGEVISGDSMQIYKQMDIGTAKVTEEEKEGIIHHCVDILNPDETYSVHDFQQTVRKKDNRNYPKRTCSNNCWRNRLIYKSSII